MNYTKSDNVSEMLKRSHVDFKQSSNSTDIQSNVFIQNDILDCRL